MKVQSGRLLTAALALGFMTAPLAPIFTSASNAREVGISQSSRIRNIPAPTRLGNLNPDAASKNLKVPDAIRKIVELKQSLSAKQQSDIKGILDRYQSQLRELSSSFSAPVDPSNLKFLGEPQTPGTDRFKAQVANDQTALTKAREGTQKLIELQGKINKEISGVLTSQQAQKFQASQEESKALLDKVDQSSASNSVTTASTASTSYAYYAGYYASLGTYYAYYAYIYDYYSYVYESSNSYAYYAYLYSYYAYYSYGVAGLGFAGASYFNNLVLGSSFGGDEYNAYSALYNAYYYSYYAYLNAYYNYYYYGGTYSYYGYIYGYSAQYYLYYAQLYAYYAYTTD